LTVVSKVQAQFTAFEKLEVFQKAYKISLHVHQVSKQFPKDEQFSLADQLRRASKSVCANIVEGVAKSFHSKKEFRRYILIALGSSDEVRMWCVIVMTLTTLRKICGKNGEMNTSKFQRCFMACINH
jgi:four helix bundle protein